MHTKSIAELSRSLAAGELSSVELTQHMLQRINDAGAALNSFISVTEEQALAQAATADARRSEGRAGPLTGIPIAHKDIFCTRGIRTSCGSRMLSEFRLALRCHGC
jgi:aspartyl-tRNA(Asn)/glutamyl-tRNA(Gln) amidotransferase subunit A